MRKVSKKRAALMRKVGPWRKALIERVKKCEVCGKKFNLCVHEIANGPNRAKALDKPYAVLVACSDCNCHKLTDKSVWPEARQLSILFKSRPEDFDLMAYNNLINPNAPDRITIGDVVYEAYLHLGERAATKVEQWNSQN